MKDKIYRKCGCGETAHDSKYQRGPEYGGNPGAGRIVWACRNCGELARDRKGAVKCRLVAEYESRSRDVRRITDNHDRGVGGDDPQTDKGG